MRIINFIYTKFFKERVLDFKRAFYLFLGSFLVYFFGWLGVYTLGVNDLAIQSEDTVPSMFIPVTILKEGTLYADSYYDMIISRYPQPDDKNQEKGFTPFYFRKIATESGFHYISAFPIMAGILALPVFIAPIASGVEVSWENLIFLSHLASALIVASSVAVMYMLLKKRIGLSVRDSTLLTVVYGFGTINFALVSQSLWQHGAVQLFTVMSLYYLYRRWMFLAGLFLSLAVISRPTAFLLFPFFVLIIIGRNHFKFLSFPRQLISQLKFMFGMIWPVLFFIWYNNIFYRDISNQGYSDQLMGSWLSRFPEGFLGLWLSPSKGILVYSPVFIFIFVGLFYLFKTKAWKKEFEYVLFFCILLLHTLVLGKWKHWYGGYGFGYRMAADVIPFMVLGLVPYLKASYVENSFYWKIKRIFFGLIVISVMVQIFGLVFFDGIWHNAYDKGFVDTGWLWSIQDSEFVFNFRRVLVKLSLLDRACPKCLPVE